MRTLRWRSRLKNARRIPSRDTPATIQQAVSNFDPNKLAGVVFNEA